MKNFVLVAGPNDASPGERSLMLERADGVMGDLNVDEVTRIDVPGKGSGAETTASGIRQVVHAAIPALQSGSLFGDRTGVLIVDAHQLLTNEAELLAEVLATADGEAVAAVFVASGRVPPPLARALSSIGESVAVKRLNARGTSDWIVSAARSRHLALRGKALEALVKIFGTDVGALGGALDQLAVDHKEVTETEVADRFRNRPDEPVWLFGDALARGEVGEALRRLGDFLQHDHPLVLLAYLNNDVRRRCLAAHADDYESFVAADGGKAGYALEKVWKSRNRTKAADLRLAVGALARADLVIKSWPEATHRVTLERLTVALARRYGGARR